MKLTKSQIAGLETILHHTQRDLEYQEGGTYSKTDDTIDKTAVKKALVGIKTIISILENQ